MSNVTLTRYEAEMVACYLSMAEEVFTEFSDKTRVDYLIDRVLGLRGNPLKEPRDFEEDANRMRDSGEYVEL